MNLFHFIGYLLDILDIHTAFGNNFDSVFINGSFKIDNPLIFI